jgi:hypothetical protein
LLVSRQAWARPTSIRISFGGPLNGQFGSEPSRSYGRGERLHWRAPAIRFRFANSPLTTLLSGYVPWVTKCQTFSTILLSSTGSEHAAKDVDRTTEDCQRWRSVF